MSDKTPPNRQPAVVERIGPKRGRIYPHHPAWTGDPRQFDAFYSLVRDVLVPQVGRPPTPAYIGHAVPRVCTFCLKDETEETFRKEAHTVPANLGNRHDFTNEECDTCNHSHGPLDEAVAAFFAIERVAIGARKRDGAPKIDGKDGTSVRYDHTLGVMSIVIDTSRDDADTRVDLSKPNTMAVTTRQPGFSFDALAREMARLKTCRLMGNEASSGNSLSSWSCSRRDD
ncbi:MAG: hypothetical protein NT062_36865 [Proteobacteria bacterium]|nr:hypothetical protein [Pseudomonadota bacterium]